MKTILSLLIIFPLALSAQLKPDADYVFQGEFTGQVEDAEVGVQVIALGKQQFRAVGYDGGLPGAGALERTWQQEAEGGLKDGKVMLKGKEYTGTIAADGKSMTVIAADGTKLGVLKKVERKSPTLGKKAPEGAIVLFDGSGVDAWEKGKMEDGLLTQGTKSKQLFQSHTLHMEFMLPYKPTARGQGRGNSGLYMQGRYEVQVLDSFGLHGKHNECGGIYSVREPDANLCLPPLVWQTYDVDFTAATFEDGKKAANARITVKHNGVLIHDNVEIPKSTTASPLKEAAEAGYIYLQNHGNPVRFRNIWVVEK